MLNFTLMLLDLARYHVDLAHGVWTLRLDRILLWLLLHVY